MRKLVLSVLGASALAISSAASAVVILPGAPFGPTDQTSFRTDPIVVTPDFVGVITATIGHSGIAAGGFSDTFAFTIGTDGMGLIGTGSGSISTTVDVNGFHLTPDLDITSVLINGSILAVQTLRDLNGVVCTDRSVGSCGAQEFFSASNVPITGGALNTITVTGTSRGSGSYGGNLTFTPTAVPEPATWAMMLIGFAGIGFQLRRKRTSGAIAQFA